MDICPSLPPLLLRGCGSAAAPLAALVHALSSLVRMEVAPSLERRVFIRPPRPVVSPCAGGHCAGVSHQPPAPAGPGSRDSVCVAVLNPGRRSSVAPGTEVTLEWRLHAVAQVLSDSGADTCAMPGARMPPGTALPPGFPYTWSGPRSVSWGAVSVPFSARCELAQLIRPLPELPSDRAQWFEFGGGASVAGEARGPYFAFCACYAALGEDVATRSGIISSDSSVRARGLSCAETAMFTCHERWSTPFHAPACIAASLPRIARSRQ